MDQFLPTQTQSEAEPCQQDHSDEASQYTLQTTSGSESTLDENLCIGKWIGQRYSRESQVDAGILEMLNRKGPAWIKGNPKKHGITQDIQAFRGG